MEVAVLGGSLRMLRMRRAGRWLLASVVIAWIGGVGLGWGRPSPALAAAAQSSANAANASTQRELINRYCVRCHNARTKTGGVVLEGLDTANVAGDSETWERVIRKLQMRAMPPPGRPRPGEEQYVALIDSLEAGLDRAAAARPHAGRPVIHRLNRFEYQNAIRDLFGLEIDTAALLPPDDVDLGFDNMAGILSVSPALLERMLSVARKVSRLAVGGPTSPSTETYRLPKMLYQDERMGEDLPFGSRGGIAVRHHFPLDGEYAIKVRLHRTLYGYIRGLGQKQHLEIRVNGERQRVFTLGGEPHERSAPLGWSGNIEGDLEWEDYWLHADDGLDVRVAARAGPQVVSAYFVNALFELEGAVQPRFYGKQLFTDESVSSPAGKPEAAIESIAISGPYSVPDRGPSPSRTRQFSCHPTSGAAERPCARRILATLASRAFRRPVARGDVETLMRSYDVGAQEGGFVAGMQLAIEHVLLDPEFLFRIERDPPDAAPGTVYRLSDLEIASRLSFFLWSSLPDDELLDLAEQRILSQPTVLERQVRRLLTDERSEALVDSFASQWLGQRKLRGINPIPELFPEFDENLRQAFLRETELFIQSQLREDRSVFDLLGANYTYVNERLARFYGIPGVYGSHFRRVTFRDRRRGGLLGQAGILALNSYPNRTSPVVRGHWILEQILGAPPPPPPPDVPPLPEVGDNSQLVSVRARLERHRRNSVCASCHSQMDPLGFALEGFDAIGKWREVDEAGSPVDTSGVAPDGTTFQGLPGLRQFLLLDRQAQFVNTVIEKLLMYALGRGLTHADMPAVRQIRREATVEDFRWSSLILATVRSDPFTMRRAQ